MASIVEICRMALLQAGSETLIESIDEPSKEAKLCKAYFQLAFDGMLREYSWNIANSDKVLTPYGTSTRYLYQYKYPNDCMRALGVYNDFVPLSSETVFNIGNSDGLLVIQTDLDQASLSYTTKITDISQIRDALFVEALSYKLGSLICTPLNGDKSLMQQLLSLYTNVAYRAQATDSNEGQADVVPDASWVQARV